MQVAAQLMKAFIGMREKVGLPLWPIMSVAIGRVDTCLGNISDPSTLHAVGPAVEIAVAMADSAKPGTIAAMSMNTTCDTRIISVPVGDGIVEVCTSVAVLAEKLFICIIKICIYRIKVSKNIFI